MPVWISNILRFVAFKLDEIIYKFVGTVYNLLIDIAETSIFSRDILSSFASRIYGILGIFMLFKVSFSILTYVVNPDDFSDKNKGINKLISNILITLVLLVITPWIFNQAMEVQAIILKDNILGRLVLGVSTDSSAVNSNINPGSQMAYQTLSAFYHVNVDKYPECEQFLYYEEGDPSGCVSSMNLKDSGSSDSYISTLKYAKATQNVGIYMDWDLVFALDSDDEFVMEYIPIISTIAGGFLVYILVTFCFDVAVRSVKLGFMQMIAPVPIISRIDPKKGKETFDKWAKSCISTYFDLFVRLLAIYFAVFVISQVLTGSMVNSLTQQPIKTNFFVRVFIILGALLFAKDLPKLITDLVGIKSGGNFSLNPLKKMAGVPVTGALTAGALGAADSLIHGDRIGQGFRRGFRSVPLTGDAKKSVSGGMTGTKDWYNKRFGEDKIKREDERAMRQDSEDIYKKYLDAESISEGSGYSAVFKGRNSSDFVDSVKKVSQAKDRKNEVESNYQQMKTKLENSGRPINATEAKALDNARIASIKASGDYDKLKSNHDSLRKIDVDNAKIEDMLNYSKDRHEAEEKVEKYYSAPPAGQTVSQPTKVRPVPVQNNNSNNK